MKLTTAVIALIATALTPSLAAPTPNPSTKTLTKRFVPGACGLHVTQHQKNEFGVGGDYQFDITIKDAAQAQIGGTSGLAIPDGQTRSVASELPATLDIGAGSVDQDAIRFAYAGHSWDTSSGQCSIGGYENGKREGDCGFTC